MLCCNQVILQTAKNCFLILTAFACCCSCCYSGLLLANILAAAGVPFLFFDKFLLIHVVCVCVCRNVLSWQPITDLLIVYEQVISTSDCSSARVVSVYFLCVMFFHNVDDQFRVLGRHSYTFNNTATNHRIKGNTNKLATCRHYLATSYRVSMYIVVIYIHMFIYSYSIIRFNGQQA